MSNRAEIQPANAAPGSGTGQVRCVKCGQGNDPSRADCSGCGAHLWVVCQECEAKNRRCDTTCARCGRRLRKAHRSRSRDSESSEGRLWIGVALVAALLLVLAGLAVLFGRSRMQGGLGAILGGGLA